jgi:hypothetical protein
MYLFILACLHDLEFESFATDGKGLLCEVTQRGQCSLMAALDLVRLEFASLATFL